MGTINYKTSSYITLGVNPNNYDDNYLEDLIEYDFNQVEYDFNQVEYDFNEAEAILNNYDFYYYHVVLEPGYYEGFSLNIENNFPVFFDDYKERAEALKEITQIKKLMLDLVEAGLVACYPGWCTGYADYKKTKKEVYAAIKEMRTEARFTPTYNQYKREACYE